jgi:hypothetical protein
VRLDVAGSVTEELHVEVNEELELRLTRSAVQDRSL